MGYRDASSKERIVILINAALRIVQFVIAIVTIGIYAVVWNNYNTDVPGRIDYAIAVGVIAMLLSLAFAIIPFVNSYRPVAFCAVFDFSLVVLYGVAFGLLKGMYDSTIHHTGKGVPKPYIYPKNRKTEQWLDDLQTFYRDSYVNIAGLILFLASGIMGAALIFIGRRSAARGLK